jgi:PAS domain S-box-containing protein
LLVAALLAMELLFLASFWMLLQKTETEARRAERSKEVLGDMQRMLRLLYDGGNAIDKYTMTKGQEEKNHFLSDLAEVKTILKSLKVAVHEDPRTLALVTHIEADVYKADASIADLIRTLDANAPQSESTQSFIQQHQKDLHQVMVSLVPDVAELTKIERRIEAESPVAQRQVRENIKTLLAAAVPVNIILALALAVFFTRSITSRLAVLVDNTDLMTRGKRLRPPLSGNDEISRLDEVFHEMATALRREEERLKASEERVRTIIEFMPIGLVVLDKTGCIEFINSRTQEMFGYKSEELMGEPLQTLFAAATEDDSDHTNAALPDLVSKSLNRISEVNAVRKGKTVFPVELTVSEFPGEEGASHLAIILDVTERFEIRRLRQAFVAMVSHELRTPLTSIKGYLSLLDMGAYGELSPECIDGAQRSEKNIARLMTLINDLLDLEKIEGGSLSISLEVTPVSVILNQAYDAVKIFAQERKVIVEMPQANWEINVDAGRIVQVMVNLLSNAIKFSPENEKVTVQVTRDSHWALFKVIDRGRGVPARFKEAIFERFQQVSESDATQKGGTGLGLAICKAIVERHDGSIGVESEEGTGTTFWFRLPL